MATKVCNVCTVEKSLDDFHNHKKMKDGKNSRCKECAKAAARQWSAENKERKVAADKAYYEANYAKVRARAKVYAKENADHLKKKAKEWVSKNRDRVNANSLRWVERNYEQHKQACKRWRSENKGIVNEKTARRDRRARAATPIWLTDEHKQEIVQVYTLSSKLTEETGVPHEVDHVIPLQGTTVCGLHVPWNLTVSTARDNRSKGNRFDDWSDYNIVCQTN